MQGSSFLAILAFASLFMFAIYGYPRNVKVSNSQDQSVPSPSPPPPAVV